MSLWIPITIFAAFVQNLRFMLQKHLKATRLKTSGATLARFLFGFPLVGVILGTLLVAAGYEFPALNWRFAAFTVAGGLGQILATLCVVALFSERNFTVGITFKKTEVVQTAIGSFLVLGETMSRGGIVAVLLGFVGVLFLSNPPDAGKGTPWKRRIFNRASGYGLASGFFFGIAAIGYRGATLSLGGDGDFVIRAATALFFSTMFQSVVMLAWLWVRDRDEIIKVVAAWRVTSMVGLTSVLGSMGWFMAFALQHAAYVKALGQIELVFSFIGSYFIFRERSGTAELLGIALVVASILVLILV